MPYVQRVSFVHATLLLPPFLQQVLPFGSSALQHGMLTWQDCILLSLYEDWQLPKQSHSNLPEAITVFKKEETNPFNPMVKARKEKNLWPS